MVDDLREGVEVERDQVVDVEAGQVLHRVERRVGAVVAAGRPGGVDPVLRVDHVAVAVDGHPEVAREREQRKRVVRRVGPQQHQRVGVRAGVRIGAAGRAADVVACDESDRRLGRRRDRRPQISALLGMDELLARRRHRVERLVTVEVGASRDSGADDREGEHEPAEAAQDPAHDGPARRIRLPVPGDRAEQRHRGRMAVAVLSGGLPDSAFKSRPHARSAPPRRRLRG